jgi:hypothetical protein
MSIITQICSFASLLEAKITAEERKKDFYVKTKLLFSSIKCDFYSVYFYS